jgi:hypothetical protein
MDQVHERPQVDDRPEAHERPIVIEVNKEAARAGHTGDHLRYILIGSCALVVIAFVLVALLVK